MKIQEIEFSRLIPADYNPRVALTPDMPEFERLKNSIETFGNVEPIVWNERTGHIVGGHQRLAVLQHLGYDTTMAQWLRSNWNDTKKGTSPARAYGGVLVPDGKDENGDVIYRYAIKR